MSRLVLVRIFFLGDRGRGIRQYPRVLSGVSP